jgi:cell division protein FtsI/penicillin-binding protein 2
MRAAASVTGTARTGQPAGVTIGGKTGTAEFGQLNPNGTYPTHGWYIGFAPFEDPEVAVAVYLEHGVGAVDAGPVARAMFEAYFAERNDDLARADR